VVASRRGGPKRRATYEDLYEIPDAMVAQIIDGELIVSPRPWSRRAHATAVLAGEVDGFSRRPGDRQRPGGWWLED
jgi:hypothetical protein